jgi:hypothetical protein
VPAAQAGGLARDAIVRGYVRLCGGPAPGRCFIEGIGFCQAPTGCITSDRVAVIDVHHRRVAEAKLRHGRFGLRVRPGTYVIELLGDGPRVRGRVLQSKSVTARARQTTLAGFHFDVP